MAKCYARCDGDDTWNHSHVSNLSYGIAFELVRSSEKNEWQRINTDGHGWELQMAALILRGDPFYVIDHQDGHGDFSRFQFQAKLLLQGGE